MKILLTLCICLSLSSVYSQTTSYTYDELNTSSLPRSVAMGNSTVSLTNSPDAVYFNTAALVTVEAPFLLYSTGQRYQLIFKSKSHDYAVCYPISKDIGTLAISIHDITFDNEGVAAGTSTFESSKSLFRIHYARYLSKSLVAGLTLNQYRGRDKYPGNTISDEQNDLSLSFLYSGLDLLSSLDDNFALGFQLDNATNSVVYQKLTFGASYGINTEPMSISFLTSTAFDNIVKMKSYSYDNMNFAVGLECSLKRTIFFRAGREYLVNFVKNVSNPQYPVTRLGAGLTVPFRLKYTFRCTLDYSYSFYDHQSKLTRIEVDSDNYFDRQTIGITLSVQ